MRIVLDDLKLLIEPSSAVPVAAVLAGKLGQARPAHRDRACRAAMSISMLCPFLAASAKNLGNVKNS